MKRCPFCAEEIQDAAIKCRFCNSMLDGSPAVPGGARPGGAGLAHAAAREVAPVPIYEGSPSWKARFWAHAGAALFVVGGVAAAVALPLALAVAWLHSLIAGAALAVLGAAWLGYLTLQRRTLHFRISTRTIDVESGLFSRNIETLQLWKVRDIEFYQSFLDRLLNVARIRVYTQDVTTPELLLWGVPESREMFDRLKNSIELARQSRNVIGVVE